MNLSIEPLIYIGIFVGIVMLVEGVYLMAFGKSMASHYDYGQADVVVSLDCDFLATEGDSIKSASQWGQRRAQANNLNRLYAVESLITLGQACAVSGDRQIIRVWADLSVAAWEEQIGNY